MDDRVQRELPFAEAEGTFAERKQLLGEALSQIGVDVWESKFMEMLFVITDGNRRGPLKRSYKELAKEPWGLCCCVRKVRDVVERLESERVLIVERNRYRSGGQEANSYSVDWEGVMETRGVSAYEPGGTTRQPGGTTRQPGGTTRHPLIGIRPSYSPSCPSFTKASPSEEAPSKPLILSPAPTTEPPAPAKGFARAEDVPLPPELDTPVFRDALRDWFHQRRSKRLSLRPEYVLQSFARLAPLGSSNAADCLRYTIAQDYQGIFPENFANGSKSKNGPGQKHHSAPAARGEM